MRSAAQNAVLRITISPQAVALGMVRVLEKLKEDTGSSLGSTDSRAFSASESFEEVDMRSTLH